MAITLAGMTKTPGAMHVATITNRRVDKSGQPREYVSHLLRRTYRDGSKVKHETLANLSPLPVAAIEPSGPARAGRTRGVAGGGLGVADATTDEVYAAMDWLAARQEAIEAKLVRTHLTGADNPDRLALFDLSSSWVPGRHCPLAARGCPRDAKTRLPQIQYGLLPVPAGRPVAGVPAGRQGAVSAGDPG